MMTTLRTALLVTPLMLALVACNKKEEQQNADAAADATVATEAAPAAEGDAAAPAAEEAAPAAEEAAPAGEGEEAPAAEEQKGSSLDTIYQSVIAGIGGGTLVSQLAGNADAIKPMIGAALQTAGLDDGMMSKAAEFLGSDTGKVFSEKASSLFRDNAGLNAAGATPELLGKYFDSEQVAGVSSFLGTDAGSKFFDAMPNIRETVTKFIADNTSIKLPAADAMLNGAGDMGKGLLEKAGDAAGAAKDAAGDAAGAATDAVKDAIAPKE